MILFIFREYTIVDFIHTNLKAHSKMYCKKNKKWEQRNPHRLMFGACVFLSGKILRNRSRSISTTKLHSKKNIICHLQTEKRNKIVLVVLYSIVKLIDCVHTQSCWVCLSPIFHGPDGLENANNKFWNWLIYPLIVTKYTIPASHLMIQQMEFIATLLFTLEYIFISWFL